MFFKGNKFSLGDEDATEKADISANFPFDASTQEQKMIVDLCVAIMMNTGVIKPPDSGQELSDEEKSERKMQGFAMMMACLEATCKDSVRVRAIDGGERLDGGTEDNQLMSIKSDTLKKVSEEFAKHITSSPEAAFVAITFHHLGSLTLNAYAKALKATRDKAAGN